MILQETLLASIEVYNPFHDDNRYASVQSVLACVGRKPTENPAIVLQQNRTSTDTGSLC